MPLKINPDKIGFNPRESGAFQLPFPEQIDFFRQKLNLPTEHYDDIIKSAHDRAFVVAGAAKADLLNDFRKAVDRSIAEGKSIGWFRKEFDKIVAKNGWSGWTGEDTEAGRDWRARVIYRTNLSASYAAGRYAQLISPAMLKNRPYWKYVHNDTVLHPRPLHLSWNGLVLKHDDPFWQAHFPPNGWGCRCRVTAVRADQYKGDKAPDDGTYEFVDRHGEVHTVPQGLDYGWDYAPGASLSTGFNELITPKLTNFSAPIGSAMMEQLRPVLQPDLSEMFSKWVDDVLSVSQSRNHSQLAGWISPKVLTGLAEMDKQPLTAEIFIEDRLLTGKKSNRHVTAGDALTEEEWKSVPNALSANPTVLYDVDTGKLLYVLPSLTDSRSVKIVIALDYYIGKQKKVMNLARSAFKIDANALLDRRRYKALN